MFDDFLVYILQYFKCLTELFQKEVKTVYEIFDKDAVCQVIVALVDRVFNDQTLGVQFLLAQVAGCPALSKEEKFELLAQIREASNKFYDEVVAAIAAKEKGLIGHAERITREEEGLKESLNNAFAQNMVAAKRRTDAQETYFHDELSTLEVAFKDIMANTLSLPINPGSSKCARRGCLTPRSDIKTALKRMSPDGSAADVIKQFVRPRCRPSPSWSSSTPPRARWISLLLSPQLLHRTPPAAHEGAGRHGVQRHGGHLPRHHRVHHRARDAVP